MCLIFYLTCQTHFQGYFLKTGKWYIDWLTPSPNSVLITNVLSSDPRPWHRLSSQAQRNWHFSSTVHHLFFSGRKWSVMKDVDTKQAHQGLSVALFRQGYIHSHGAFVHFLWLINHRFMWGAAGLSLSTTSLLCERRRASGVVSTLIRTGGDTVVARSDWTLIFRENKKC